MLFFCWLLRRKDFLNVFFTCHYGHSGIFFMRSFLNFFILSFFYSSFHSCILFMIFIHSFILLSFHPFHPSFPIFSFCYFFIISSFHFFHPFILFKFISRDSLTPILYHSSPAIRSHSKEIYVSEKSDLVCFHPLL